MNIKIELDVSPKELRQAFGLPDLEPLQQEMMNLIRERVTAVVDGLDPMRLLKLLLPESLPSFESLQKFLWQTAAAGAASPSEEPPRRK